MTTIEELNFVTLVADPGGNMPAQYAPLAGKVVGVPPEMVQPLPMSPGQKLYGIPGYAQLNATTGGTEWVMSDVLDDTTRRAIRDIPGNTTGGWKVNDAFRQYRDVARTLIELGVDRADIVTMLTTLFNAAKTEVTAP